MLSACVFYRLKCPLSAAVVLASYAVQSELGDYSPDLLPGYLSKRHFLPEQDEDFLSRVEALHPGHRGLKQSEAELCFLNTARTLELYGVELHTASDSNTSPLLVGLASGGVAIFCNMICSSFFPWVNIIKISFKRKRFLIQLRRKHGETQDCVVSLVLPCPRTCKNLWRSCVDHHSFFHSKSAHSPHHTNLVTQIHNKLLSQHWTLGNSVFNSSYKVMGGMEWNPVGRGSSSSEHLETKSLPSRSPPLTPNWRSPRIRHGARKPRPSSVELNNDLRDLSEGEDVFYTYRVSLSSSRDSHDGTPRHRSETHTHTHTHTHTPWRGRGHVLRIRYLVFQAECCFCVLKSALGDGDLLLIRIAPDHGGKFGFNVKGGVDQKTPLVISQVNPDSPAGRVEPRLLEGDQVVLINGRDISEHTHDQVVMFIRASRESHSRELALLIRRKALSLTGQSHADALLLPGQSHTDALLLPGQSERGQTLEESMKQLERGLQTGTLTFHFENLYRRKPGLTVACACLPENTDKNRYKDVLPYDVSRVVLRGKEDYINASHITVSPVCLLCLRYIAAQGPLPQTCTHFWQSVWEQRTQTIIMLTTLTERGRTKCHQYWPHPPEVSDYGYLRVSCHSEECNLAYVTRQFTLTHTQLGEERAVTHLQYVAWPDHGVPDDPSDFLLFVNSVRETRTGDTPLMVHCSAGIGRTGVLITMEMALTLLESGRPVLPLDIVRTLRDQRAMMIQTPCQFRFVCEAILRVYRERGERSAAP
uniref:protein-tyrosine-phosphatase n=1 Tax=Esox lucius TaxID=8010 RepID=A0AAY5L4A6_ESOLU